MTPAEAKLAELKRENVDLKARLAAVWRELLRAAPAPDAIARRGSALTALGRAPSTKSPPPVCSYERRR